MVLLLVFVVVMNKAWHVIFCSARGIRLDVFEVLGIPLGRLHGLS
jgi:hypothetical protein